MKARFSRKFHNSKFSQSNSSTEEQTLRRSYNEGGLLLQTQTQNTAVWTDGERSVQLGRSESEALTSGYDGGGLFFGAALKERIAEMSE